MTLNPTEQQTNTMFPETPKSPSEAKISKQNESRKEWGGVSEKLSIQMKEPGLFPKMAKKQFQSKSCKTKTLMC